MIIRRVVSLWPIILLACCFFVQGANGYEYHLQSPAGIGRITAVSTASIKADGTLSESLTSWTQACSGRVCAPRVYHCTAGTWDSIGNLLTSSTTTGACAANSPISTSGSEQVYAVSGSETAGFDTRGFGFLAYPAPHYVWTGGAANLFAPFGPGVSNQAADGGYIVVPYTPPTTFTLELLSDGDLPLSITGTVAQVFVSGYGTVGTGKVTSVTGDCLSAPLAPGLTCTLSVTFDPSTITTPASTGYGYNVMTLALASDAGALPDWSTHFTVTGIPVPEE